MVPSPFSYPVLHPVRALVKPGPRPKPKPKEPRWLHSNHLAVMPTAALARRSSIPIPARVVARPGSTARLLIGRSQVPFLLLRLPVHLMLLVLVRIMILVAEASSSFVAMDMRKTMITTATASAVRVLMLLALVPSSTHPLLLPPVNSWTVVPKRSPMSCHPSPPYLSPPDSHHRAMLMMLRVGAPTTGRADHPSMYRQPSSSSLKAHPPPLMMMMMMMSLPWLEPSLPTPKDQTLSSRSSHLFAYLGEVLAPPSTACRR
mmetsp:Transcript_1722/g.3784  ORF Transcript_1722/g.3784 Transcript_1722/m.3784 type:complete len:260 (+) Transcript_1722:1058-1837(+)